ncbi:lysophospholipid acyltransferase family protein [Microvirga sp. STS02]|uniref:lysophospholipid acyltransferase family protein n=1 Tax=Hymenobacter negativus TaxID=2795026 RepID=UPI001B83C2E2|nr:MULTISPECIES: lysophospholipid acyltransferase family protein [Bacteria]MBR7207473.1 lysophospholipid acyltransferase family protein [Microvirga sp. STS02]
MDTKGTLATTGRPYAWYFEPLWWLLLGLAHLPLAVLYLFAEVIYFLLAYVVRYRWRVVTENLRNSFPGKTPAEIERTGKAFYRHFAQVVVEILKLAAISPAELRQRLRFTNPELMTRHFAENRLVLSLGSHMGNWEWILNGAALEFPGRAAGVYKPLNNLFFETLMRRLRTRFGADAVPMLATLRYLVAHRGEGRTLSLLTDQAAGPEDRPYWTQFLNQDTSFYTSADRLAVQLDCAVLYVGIRRARRGYYEVTFTELPDGRTAKGAPAGTFPITEAFARQLEADMRASPEQYLWTHRRWKHKR